LAADLCTEIISADSRQFYHDLKIGTAPPSKEDLGKVKHHFIGHLNLEDKMDVYRYEEIAMALITERFQDKDSLVFTGGSGLYIDAVLKGLDALPDVDPMIREGLIKQLDEEGIESLQIKLKSLDPEFYKQVDLANPNRLIRALEVCIGTGKPFSSYRTESTKKRNFDIIKIGLNRDREELYERINRRVDIMVELGLVEEARKFYPYRHLNSLKTVGYRELFECFAGNCTLDFAIEKIKINTRRYAKRQLTWFRRDTEIKWFHPDDYSQLFEYVKQRMQD